MEIDPYEYTTEINQPYFHVHPYENENINFDNIEKISMSWKDTLSCITGIIMSLTMICYILVDLYNLKKSGL